MSLLSIVQDAAREIGLPSPTTAFGNMDENVAQMVRYATKEGRELVRKYEWQALQKEVTFPALAQEAQTGMVPVDHSRFVNETFFNRSRNRRLAGPLTGQEWQMQKATTTSPLLDTFRQRGNAILIAPLPTAGDTFAFEYISKFWVDTNADGEGEAEQWTADTDVPLFDSELITLGIIWRFKHGRGFDYAEDFRTYEVRLAQMKAADGSKRTLNLAGTSRSGRPMAPMVPEGSWNT